MNVQILEPKKYPKNVVMLPSLFSPALPQNRSTMVEEQGWSACARVLRHESYADICTHNSSLSIMAYLMGSL